MMMGGDRKGIAALIIKKMGKPGKEEIEKKDVNENGDEIDNNAGLDAAVQEMFDAFQVSNKDKFKIALKSFIELCENNEEEEEEELEGPEEESSNEME